MTSYSILSLFAQGFCLGAVSACVPGPDLLLVARSSLRFGRLAGLRCTGGIAIGLLSYTIAACCLSTAISAAPVWIFNTIRMIGAGYLCYLGFCWIRAGVAKGHNEETPPSGQTCFAQGLFSALRNPKLMLWLLAVTTQIIGQQSDSVAQVAVLLGLVAGPLACFSTISLLVGMFRTKVSTGWERVLDRLAGTILILLGVAGVILW